VIVTLNLMINIKICINIILYISEQPLMSDDYTITLNN